MNFAFNELNSIPGLNQGGAIASNNLFGPMVSGFGQSTGFTPQAASFMNTTSGFNSILGPNSGMSGLFGADISGQMTANPNDPFGIFQGLNPASNGGISSAAADPFGASVMTEGGLGQVFAGLQMILASLFAGGIGSPGDASGQFGMGFGGGVANPLAGLGGALGGGAPQAGQNVAQAPAQQQAPVQQPLQQQPRQQAPQQSAPAQQPATQATPQPANNNVSDIRSAGGNNLNFSEANFTNASRRLDNPEVEQTRAALGNISGRGAKVLVIDSNSSDHGNKVASIIGGDRENSILPDADTDIVTFNGDDAYNPRNFFRNAAQAIVQAVDNDFTGINASMGIERSKVNLNDPQTRQAFEEYQRAVEYAVSKDIPVVVSAGNFGRESSNGDNQNALHIDGLTISVAAAEGNQMASYSSGQGNNSPSTITADGSAVATGINSETNFIGTSAAAPRVTAVLVAMKQANPDLSIGQLTAILANTATDFVAGNDDGYGLMNTAAAIQQAINTPGLAA